jgi:hypothetical protein
MEPNLKSFNATWLEFSTTISLSPQQIFRIRGASDPDTDGSSLFFDSYPGHRALATVKGVGEVSETARECAIEFDFMKRSGGRLEKSIPRISQLLEALSVGKEQLSFTCRVAFEFGRGLHPRSIISLPMKYIEAPNMPFDRIQGLHMVKLDGDKIKYDIYLDAPTKGIIYANVEFKHASALNRSLADDIMMVAKSILDGVVFVGSKDA